MVYNKKADNCLRVVETSLSHDDGAKFTKKFWRKTQKLSLNDSLWINLAAPIDIFNRMGT